MVKQKPVQKVDERTPDEKALDRVVVTQYVFAGLLGLWTLFSAIVFGLFLLAPYQSAAMIGSTTLMAIVSLVSGVALTVANINSARAIAARADAHVSFFVAGVNAMLFPLGTAMSVYSWRVLNRPGVRAIYAANGEFATAQIAAEQPQRKAKFVALSAVEVNLDHELPHIEEAEEEMWRKLEEEHKRRDKGNSAAEQEEPGPVRLVPGSD